MLKVPLIVLICCLTLATGCQQQRLPPAPPAARAAAAVKLAVLVVDDGPLAAGIRLLRGEWAQRSGGQLELEEWTVDQLLAAAELPADLIIYPSRHVGTLVDRDWLRPVRKSVLQSVDLALEDMFPLVRNTTIRYGRQIYGLSLGEPPLMLVAPIATTPRNRFATWQQIDFRLAIAETALPHPLAAELLARSTACRQQRGLSADWFDVESMQPRIADPPFLRGLEEMLKNARSTTDQANHWLALSWPTARGPTQAKRVSTEPTVFLPLPRSDQVYNPLREIWEARETQPSLAWLGFAGRSASVTRSTRNSASAFKLLAWMISADIATQISSRSGATVWFRNSQAPEADRWLSRSGAGSEVGDETAAAVTRLLSSDDYCLLPRIPGIDDYLQILDTAISRAFVEDRSAQDALSEVAEQWNTVTERYGRERQRLAYRRHLGMSGE